MGTEYLEKKGGDLPMESATIALEVERVMNLISGFGWSKVKEEVVDNEIHITVKKQSVAAETAGTGESPS